tara:strand:+ start:173 stop:643 length:471 start_codon:yes stop_codon:yes gene_type:complete
MLEHGIKEKGYGLLPTPRSQEPGRTTEGYGRGLAELIEGKKQLQKKKLIPTPVASDGTVGSIIGKKDSFKRLKSGSIRKINQNGVDGSIGLGRFVKLMPTPTASDANTHWNDKKRFDSLTAEINRQKEEKDNTGQLNPRWVEWLMGFPIGWTDLKG